jgi:hypothetical protein
MVRKNSLKPKGHEMKSKNKPVPLRQQAQNETKAKDERQKVWRSVGLRLAAILLIIVFLASECASLLPGE